MIFIGNMEDKPMRSLISWFAWALLSVVLTGCTDITQFAQEAPSPISPFPTVLMNTPPPCPVTIPNGMMASPDLGPPSPIYHGNGALFTGFPSDGIVKIQPGQVEPDGWLGWKWPWWRKLRVVYGRLTIQGRRLDAPAPPLRAEILDGYGDTGFQPSAIYFPTEGCWEITGKVGDVSLTFVVLVVKVPAQK